MFEKRSLMFLYAVSPVHMGAGTALGAIDNPIQRERHTQHPMAAGSGLKGALRDVARESWRNGEFGATGGDVSLVFGPATDEDPSEFAGALSIGDGQIVLFPVRSLRRSFVYTTSPTALGRLARLAHLAGVTSSPLLKSALPSPEKNEACLVNEGLLSNKRLVLETFAFEPKITKELQPILDWLSSVALPGDGAQYFRDKLKTDTVVLHDDRFNYFARNATVVEPHVRIDDATGTADDGGLFYTENLPPESLLVSLVMASHVRKKDVMRSAAEVIEQVKKTFDARVIQIGGDATTGRGQVMVSFVAEGA